MNKRCLLIRGGRIWTGEPGRPEAEAVLVAGERIVAVGTMEEVRDHLLAKGARELSLAGKP